MSRPMSLQEYLGVLTYAAGPGAAKVATSVTASGNLQAKTGLTVQTPGPALQSAVTRRTGTARRRSNAARGAAQVPKVADRMARNALNQGAELLEGERR